MNKLKIAHHYKTVLPAEDFILTGAYAVSQMGLNVKSKDLDIILVKPKPSSLEVLERLEKENPPKNLISYPTALKNKRLFRFMHEGVGVDVFVYDSKVSTNIQTKCGLNVATLEHIISAKKNLGREKDYLQLLSWSKKLISSDEFDSFLRRF